MGRRSEAHKPGGNIAYNSRRPIAARITMQAHKDLNRLAGLLDMTKQDAIAYAFAQTLAAEKEKRNERRH